MQDDPLWNMANELRDVLPLSALSEADGWELVSHMRVRRFGEGAVVYHRGDPAADAFVVHQGLVKSVLPDGEGHELLIGLYGRGEFFGTVALFEEQALRESTIVATTPTTALQVARDDALRVLERNPQAMRFMFGRFVRMIYRLSRLAERHVYLDAASRLALFLIELERLAQRVRLTQDELAAAIGASARTVRRLLADFATRGLIAIEPSGVRILDAERLRREIRPWMPSELRHEFFRDLDDVLFRDT